jgi:hypothetical protein
LKTALPNSFNLQLPDAWYPVSLDRDDVRRMVDEATKRPGVESFSADQVAWLKATLGKMVVEAKDSGVNFCATYVDLLPEEDVVPATSDGPLLDDEGKINPQTIPQMFLSAVVLLATYPASDISPEGTAVSVAALLAALETPTSTRSRYLRNPAQVLLPAGPSVEVKALETFNAPELREPIPIYALTYHLPISNGEGLAILSFRTPCLGLADEFTELFKAMAETLEFEAE